MLHCKNQHISKLAPSLTQETNTFVKQYIPSQQKQQRFQRLIAHLNCYRKENSSFFFFLIDEEKGEVEEAFVLSMDQCYRWRTP